MKPWHASSALHFEQLLQSRGLYESWMTQFRSLLGSCASRSGFFQTRQPDMIYVPQRLSSKWIEIVGLMIQAAMEFHLVFPTAALGISGADVETLISYGTNQRCSCRQQLSTFPNWHGYHPCKLSDPGLEQFVESLLGR